MCQILTADAPDESGTTAPLVVVPTWLFGCFSPNQVMARAYPRMAAVHRVTMGHVRTCTGTGSG